MTDESWGHWVDHDHNGVPPIVYRRFIEIEFTCCESQCFRRKVRTFIRTPIIPVGRVGFSGGAPLKVPIFLRYRVRNEPGAADLIARAERAADIVVPEYRKGPRASSCTGLHAKRWDAAYLAATLAFAQQQVEAQAGRLQLAEDVKSAIHAQQEARPE